MSCGECAAKAVLIVVNIIFMILGLGLLVAGVLVKVAWEQVSGFVLPLLEGALSSPAGSSPAGVDTSSLLEADVLGAAAYVFVGLGCLMLVAGFLGCIGGLCKIKTPLIIYTCIVLLLFLVKLVFLILLLTAVLDASFKDYLQTVIDTKYGGVEDTSTESFAFNLIMTKYKCCGINDYRDFDTAENWVRSYETEYDGETVTIDLVAPVACCKTLGEFPDVTLKHENCTWDTRAKTSNFKKGCWESIVAEINSYKIILIGSYGAVLGIEIICAVVALYLIRRTIKDEKDGKINPMTD